jgi:hypothetical protein
VQRVHETSVEAQAELEAEVKRLQEEVYHDALEQLADRQSEVQVLELVARLEELEAGSNLYKDALTQAAAENARLMEHSAVIEAQLCNKLQEVEQRMEKTSSAMEQACKDLEQSRSDAHASSTAAEHQLAAAKSKIEMLSCALKGTEQELSVLLTKTEDDHATRSQELAELLAGAHRAPQSEVAQLTELKALLHKLK